jgi:hypothetical protein
MDPMKRDNFAGLLVILAACTMPDVKVEPEKAAAVEMTRPDEVDAIAGKDSERPDAGARQGSAASKPKTAGETKKVDAGPSPANTDAGRRTQSTSAADGDEDAGAQNRCFTKGQWKVDNLVPCLVEGESQRFFLYSSRSSAGGYVCDPVRSTPPPAPDSAWSSSTLQVDCAGKFELCYTLKAGSSAAPKPTDCSLVKLCVNTVYAQPGLTQRLPDLPGWSTEDSVCSKRFVDRGGYGEMSVRGTNQTNQPIDDGHGQPLIFERTTYCSPTCNDTPDLPECKDCSVNGTGMF